MTQSMLFTEAAPAAEPTHTTLHVEVVTLPLPGGLCLRLGRMDGELALATGFADSDPLRAVAAGLRIPVECWADVRRALDELAS